MRLRLLLYLFEQRRIALEYPQRLLQIPQMHISCLDGFDFVLRNNIQVCLGGISVAIGNSASQFQLSGIGQVLRYAESNVRKFAVGKAGEGAQAPDRKLLNVYLWIGRR